MPGFFRDTSGLDNNDNGLSTNNAAADLARSSAAPPNLFDRLFSGQGAPKPPVPGSTPPPAISSGDGLVARVLQSSAPPPPTPPSQAQPQASVQEQPYNPTETQAPPSMMRAPPERPAFQPSMLRAQPQDQPQPFPQGPFTRGIPQFGSPGPGTLPRGLPMPSPTQGAGAPPFPSLQMPGANVPAGKLTPEVAAAIADFVRQQQAGGGSAPNYRSGGGVPRGFFRGGAPQRFARGGYPQLMGGMPERQPFSAGSYVAPDGQGDGRSDHIEAVLSPGEFVQDAETVSLLGNGDNDAGARGFEAIRKEIRKHKGKALAKGKFSPDAQSPAKLTKIGMRAATRTK